MWPFDPANILDQQVAQAMPQSAFGTLVGPQPPSQSAQSAQNPTGGNRILQNPQLMQALGRMGASINQANARGAGFGGSLLAGFDGFNANIEEQRQLAEEKRLRDAQIGAAEARAAADRKDGQYGVRSGGFEGDIARAQAVLNDPMAREQDKSIARAVIQTAERMQGGYDPVTGEYRMNPRARIGEAPSPAAMPLPQPEMPASPSSSAIPVTGTLLPPPVEGVTPDASMFSPASTGNRKVDAALQEESGKAQIAGRRAVNEGVAKADTETFGQIANQTRTLASMLPQLQRIETLAANTKTGGIGVARNEFGKIFGLDLDGVPEAQAITAIQNAIGPSLRTPGSGSSSDKDVAIFMSSIPTLMNTPQGIREINRTYEKLLDRKKKEEGIARKLLRDDGNLERFYEETEKLGPVFEGGKVGVPVSEPSAPQFDRSAIEAEMKRRMLK